MAFLAYTAFGPHRIDPLLLSKAAGSHPITWFDLEDPGLGGAICLSPLTSMSRLKAGNCQHYFFIGRIRLDRRQELQTKLVREQHEGSSPETDADLCLLAYHKWGAAFVDHIHGDFAFVIYDGNANELTCVRDRFGVRMLAWSKSRNGCWISGSLRDLVAARASDVGQFDPCWISDFLRIGYCPDPTRSVYADVHRLAPAHILHLGRRGLSTERYWRLEIEGPTHLKSPADLAEEFHHRLDAAMRDRLPPDRVGLMMSGGLDSSTLAAKAIQLGGVQLQVAARTWIVGGEADPEAKASVRVAEYLGLHHTVVDAGQLQFDPRLLENPVTTVEPALAAMAPPGLEQETIARRKQATCWLYGEGPDNALTFEWQMQLGWLVWHRQWGHLPGAISDYVSSKSLADWKISFSTRMGRQQPGPDVDGVDLSWVRGAGSVTPDEPTSDWRPAAHRNLSSALWPNLFERLDADSFGIDWRHPYMDLRVMEFLLSTPPIPWARHKLLIRHAMKGRLPLETLRRRKTPLYRDVLGDLLRQHLPAIPRRGSAVEPFVDIERLPAEPSTYADVYALARLVILDRWLTMRHG